MQLRVWKFNNGTTLLVRLFKHNSTAHKKLWIGGRTNGDVGGIILNLLKHFNVIVDKNDWDYSVNIANSLRDQDEHEEKGQCFYFAWSVKKQRLNFLYS